MTEAKAGELILKSIPTQAAREKVSDYLDTLFADMGKSGIEKHLQHLPAVFQVEVPYEKGWQIAAALRSMGAIAVFRIDGKIVPPSRKDRSTPPPKRKRSMLRLGVAMICLAAIAAVAYLLFWEQEDKAPEQARSQLVLVETPGKQPKNILDAFLYQYRPRPDRRFLNAFVTLTERWRLLYKGKYGTSNLHVGAVQADDVNVFVPLLRGKKEIGRVKMTLPFTFADGMKALKEYAALLQGHTDIPDGFFNNSREAEEVRQRAETYVHSVDPRFICVALSGLEKNRAEEGPFPRMLLTAAKAYNMLVLTLSCDRTGLVDFFATEALAWLALAARLDDNSDIIMQEAFLAMNMGYAGHAAQQMENRLEQQTASIEDDILYAYLRKDIHALEDLVPNYNGVLARYLLTKLYRQNSMREKAQKAAADMLSHYPNLYPALHENIRVGPLQLAKMWTILYPLEILFHLEQEIHPNRAFAVKPWKDKLEGLAGVVPSDEISARQFEDKLKQWEPFPKGDSFTLLIDAARVRRMYRILYFDAIYQRYNLLANRWGVNDMAATYVASLAEENEANPLILYMQAKTAIEAGNRTKAETLFKKMLLRGDTGIYLFYRAFANLTRSEDRLAFLPRAADKLDGRPANLFRMGWLCQKGVYHYDLAARYIASGLVLDPYNYSAYNDLAWLKGSDKPLLAALKRFPDSFELLKEAGDYYAGQAGYEAQRKAVALFSKAQTYAPSSKDITISLAKALRDSKQYTRAIKVLDAWLSAYGGTGLRTIIVKGWLASIYLKMDRPRKALACLGDAVHGYQAGVMMNVAKALEALGKTKQAAMQYMKAVDRYPTVAHVLSGTAAFFWRHEEYADAAKIIAVGRKIEAPDSRWYFADFLQVFEEKTDERIMQACRQLQKTGATSWELNALAWELTGKNRFKCAYGILKNVRCTNSMHALEQVVRIYQLLIRWGKTRSAEKYLADTIESGQRVPLMMVLYKQGLFAEILKYVGNPDDTAPAYREFMWLQALIAWLAEDKPKGEIAHELIRHYAQDATDYYHHIGQYLLGKRSLDELLVDIRSGKQRCEIAYYIGLAYRLRGEFETAAHWYHICRETNLTNNGEYHWASQELIWWATIGTNNRHRLVKADRELSQAIVNARD